MRKRRNQRVLAPGAVATLDTDANSETAWDELADQRERELDAGAVEAVPLEVVVARLEVRFPRTSA